MTQMRVLIELLYVLLLQNNFDYCFRFVLLLRQRGEERNVTAYSEHWHFFKSLVWPLALISSFLASCVVVVELLGLGVSLRKENFSCVTVAHLLRHLTRLLCMSVSVLKKKNCFSLRYKTYIGAVNFMYFVSGFFPFQLKADSGTDALLARWWSAVGSAFLDDSVTAHLCDLRWPKAKWL